MLADMGCGPQIRGILAHLPKEGQTALYTASWTEEVREVAARLTKHAMHIQVGRSGQPPDATTRACGPCPA